MWRPKFRLDPRSVQFLLKKKGIVTFSFLSFVPECLVERHQVSFEMTFMPPIGQKKKRKENVAMGGNETYFK